MIFVTVGAQMPFDRMIRAVDQWARTRERSDVFAQIGLTDYRPQFLQWTAFMDPPEFRKKVEMADVVIAHAGMGSILTALEVGKPILVMPRRGDLRETRNDHQIATAKRFLAQGRIFVAFDEEHLLEKLDFLDKLRPTERIASHASPELLAALTAFIEGKALPVPTQNAPVADPLRVVEPAPMHRQRTTSDRVEAGRVVERLGVQLARTYPAAHIKSRLRAIILLAGRLRMTDLSRRAGRSRLDLPIDATRTLLAYWRDEAIDLSVAWNAGNPSMRVLIDQASPMPTLPAVLQGVTISVERDKSEFRGTGGVLRDACESYDDEDWVLVANAAQLLFGSLRKVVDRLADAGGEINVVADHDGTPNGLILLRCGVLRTIADIGFHDMKEQVIPSLAKKHAVRVVSTRGLTSRPIHSLKDFTQTLRSYYAWRADEGNGARIPRERWKSRFSICEQGAVVAPSAIVHDSVILQGAVVEKGAVVVRSVVGQGARVRSGQKIFDEVVV